MPFHFVARRRLMPTIHLIFSFAWYWQEGFLVSTFAFCLDPSSVIQKCPSKLLAQSSSINDECDFDPKIQVALAAVRKACAIAIKLQEQLDTLQGTMTKDDASPVTIADFASQAVVLRHLRSHFPDDVYIAEEESGTLTPGMIQLIQHASGIDDENMLRECIDLGRTFYNSGQNRTNVWCLDPIDGTKGFLRKEQYCVALGFLEDGIPTIGILACPNLSMGKDESIRGTIFVACRGQGCYEVPLIPGSSPLVRLPHKNLKTIHDPKNARFCVGVEQGFADPIGRCKDMAKALHGHLDSNNEIIHSIRMDSQAKYGVIARGDAEFYVRLPTSDHREWIWDVAPGVLILEEVGGRVTDAGGHLLNFSKGAKLSSNGILGGATTDLHKALLNAFNQCDSSKI